MLSHKTGFFGVVSRLTLCALVAQMPLAEAAWAQAPEPTTIKDDPVSYDSLTLELALTEKTLADERFLRDERKDALGYYCQARNTLSGLDLETNPAQATSLKLLRADIDYRLLLLANGYEFGGASQSLTPRIPRVHLQRLTALNKKFGELDDEIDKYLARVTNGQIKASEFYAKLTDLNSNERVQGVTGESLQVQQEFMANKQEALDRRIVALHGERTVLENQYAQAKAQAEAASAALTRAVTNAATSAAGIPPDLAQNVQNGKWDQVVLTALQSPAVAQSPVFADAIADLGANGQLLAGYVREGQDLIAQGQAAQAKYEEYNATVQTAVAALREPTFASLLQAGQTVYAQVDPASRAQWKDAVDRARPVVAAIELIQASDDGELVNALRGQAETYLAKEASRGAGVLLAQAKGYVARADVDLAAYQRDLLVKAARLTLDPNDARKVLDLTARSWSGGLLARLPPAARDQLVTATGAGSADALAQRLAASGVGAVQNLMVIQGQQVIVYNRASSPRSIVATLPLNALSQVATGPIETVGAQTRQEIARAQDVLDRSEGALRRVLIQSVPAQAVTAAIQAAVAPTSAGELALLNAEQRKTMAWNEIVNDLSPTLRSRASDKLAAFQAGTLAVEQITTKTEQQATQAAKDYAANSAPNEDAPAADAPSASDAQAQAIATAALNYFAPGAGVALQVVASFSAFNEATEKAARYAKALQDNLNEELQVTELINDARLRQVIFGKEREIADIMRQSALSQYDTYRSALKLNNAAVQSDRARIALRRSLYFWLAERQRQEFNALNSSLALWLGEPDSPQGLIARKIQEDPQNLRLALDSEIHLFDWLNRERESTRADVAGLRSHWDQMLALSTQACQDLGCEPGSARLGLVGQTDAVSLSSLLTPRQLSQLRHWQQRKPAHEPFVASIVLRPDSSLFNDNIENLRVIDVAVGRSNRSGKMTPLTRIELGHPGVGYVLLQGRYRREALKLVNSRGLMPYDNFDLQALSTRWDVEEPKTRVFEGYPAFTAWQLTFDAYRENYEVRPEDVKIRFAYHYNEPYAHSEAQLIRSVSLASPDFPAESLFDYLATWTNGATLQKVSTEAGERSVRVPLQGSAEVDATIVPLLEAQGARAMTCASTDADNAPTPQQPARDPPGQAPPPTVVRVCKSDADIRRMLTDYYAKRLAPGETHDAARKRAEIRLQAIRREHCSGPMKVADLEVG